MAYKERFYGDFESLNGKTYRLVIYQDNFEGTTTKKRFGAAPKLTIEEGNSGIKGTSLTFALQADVTDELRCFYTVNNKEFKVVLYQDNNIIWQGFILPEIYSEAYITPPYDVTITATDQIATLKSLNFEPTNQRISIFNIINTILKKTGLNLELRIFSTLFPYEDETKPFLMSCTINDTTFTGKNCYEVLSLMMAAFNGEVVQINNQWIISRLTDNTTEYFEINSAGSYASYDTETPLEIGELYVKELHPVGSLTMTSIPALQGVNLSTTPFLTNSMLLNPNLTSKDNWNVPTMIDNKPVSFRYPSIVNKDGLTYASNCFELRPQGEYYYSKSHYYEPIIYQTINVDSDNEIYTLSVDYIFNCWEGQIFKGTEALLLIQVTFVGENGETYRLTNDGWITLEKKSDGNKRSAHVIATGSTYYEFQRYKLYSNINNYSNITVKFPLFAQKGQLTIGFINGTKTGWDDGEILREISVAVTNVYLQVGNVTNSIATSIVQPNASQSQIDVNLIFVDRVNRQNDYDIVYNSLGVADTYPSKWILNNREFDSYFLAMFQDYSKFYGTKKMQLNGTVSGNQLLAHLYIDAYSKKLLRLKSANIDFLNNELNGYWEEIVNEEVDFEISVYPGDGATVVSPSVTTGQSSANISGTTSSGNYAQAIHDHAGQLIRPATLVVPNTIPTETREGEIGIYYTEDGTASEEPSEAGGVSDYNDLSNKPKINNTELISGDNSLDRLGIAPKIHTHTTSQITDFQTGVTNISENYVESIKGKANGLASLGEDNKVISSQLPDFLLGQLLYGGTINATSVATLTTEFKNRYKITSSTLTITDSNAKTYTNVYFIATSTGTSGIVKTLDCNTGDWVISNGAKWTKIDNTDSVSEVCGLTGSITASSLINAMDLASLYAALSHTHTISQITDLQNQLTTLQNNINAKWTYDENTIKAVKVNSATDADKLGNKTPDNYAQSVKVGTTQYNTLAGVVTIPAYPTTLPASDVSLWAKASTKPTYTKAEIGLANVDNTADKDKNVKSAVDAENATKLNNILGDNYYHTGNANLDSVNWRADVLRSKKLVVPNIAPSGLNVGEIGLYYTEDGGAAEVPGMIADLLFAGLLNKNSIAVLSTKFKDIYQISASTLQLTEDNAQTYEGCYFVMAEDATSGIAKFLNAKQNDTIVANAGEWYKLTDSNVTVRDLNIDGGRADTNFGGSKNYDCGGANNNN